eukprot:8307005-Pyramimonas_sp.AAC.1
MGCRMEDAEADGGKGGGTALPRQVAGGNPSGVYRGDLPIIGPTTSSSSSSSPWSSSSSDSSSRPRRWPNDAQGMPFRL